MARLAAQWREQQAESQRLDAAIEENLRGLGFGSNRDGLARIHRRSGSGQHSKAARRCSSESGIMVL